MLSIHRGGIKAHSYIMMFRDLDVCVVFFFVSVAVKVPGFLWTQFITFTSKKI